MRVLHCPSIVAGNAQQLARAEREIGLESHSVAFSANPFGYECDEILGGPKIGRIRFELRRWNLFLRAVRDYDVIHFNFGQTIMPQCPTENGGTLKEVLIRNTRMLYAKAFEMMDLSCLRYFGKTIFVTFQGDDARQGDYCRKHFKISFVTEVEKNYYTPESDTHKRWRIDRFMKQSDGIFALNPDLLHVLPKTATFLPYCNIDLREWKFRERVVSARPLVVHAPSHRGVKGTRFIVDALAELKAEGIQFEYQLVENMPHSEARKVYERADLLIDQLLAGWYGGLALELMALGTPVVCYLRNEDLMHIPEEMRRELPIIRAEPNNIKEVLKYWLTEKRTELPMQGRYGRTFVERWHDPLKIAREMKLHYEVALAQRRSTFKKQFRQ